MENTFAASTGIDEWYPWFLKETVPLLEADKEIGLLYGDIDMIDLNGEITEKKVNVPDFSQLEKKQTAKNHFSKL